MKCIVLLGYMCAGKTTVGRVLAKDLGFMFYDLDWYIEERFHMRVPQIFAEQGEEKFRDLERRMLHEAAEFNDVVLSLGGGTPCFFDNMDYLNQVAHTFYLKASPEVLVRHIAMSRGRRPLLEGKTPEELDLFVRQQLQEREAFYGRAHHIIDINLLDSFDRIQTIADKIRKLL
ncbi:MAG: shikimate kinase [Bacteroidales bacterium]|nr:shikimate kinase [Alloprevotella sp.]MBR1644935.1 shikimate kinase [Bacteroidales bacterium]MBR1645066.1 shikimate kinase [Bacteroidales bacterium]